MKKKCCQLNNLPPVVSESQQETYEPNCKFFCQCGKCNNKDKKCTFESKTLELKKVEE